jgi:assimilatory nitrate reductase catalytic subunit
MIAPGQVFMPFHFAETNVNEVTQSAFDPISREPNYKQCAVRVEKTPPSGGTTAGRKFFRRKSVSVQERSR